MKHNGVWNFLGCCVIAAGIVVAGCIIAVAMPETPVFPGNLHVTTSDGTTQFGEYLSKYEAAVYLKLSDEEFETLLSSGRLDSAVLRVGDSCTISKQALDAWVSSELAG